MDLVKRFVAIPFRLHVVAGFIIRMFLIVYGDYHDERYNLPYTDVDYRVFTDAARHVVNGDSPYKRHTYRYSPIIAYMLVPNILIGMNFGKLLFSIFDVLLTIAIYYCVDQQIDKKHKRFVSNGFIIDVPKSAACFWLYHPLSVSISTRGNADSVPCFFIILSIIFLQTNLVSGLKKYVLSGLLLGLSIHLRLYPLVFSFPMYLSLGEYKITRLTGIREGLWMLMPNKKQLILALSCIFTLFSLTYAMYSLYKYEFLFETYIYHLFRKDTRHNFSVMFYYSYLTMDDFSFDIVKIVAQFMEFAILFVISVAFGRDPASLNFALFCQAFTLVTFNSVVTSQYFIWFLSLFPLVAFNFKMVPKKTLLLFLLWVFSQGTWLLEAYLLEFSGYDTFFHIWFKSQGFFFSNCFILAKLIECYCPTPARSDNKLD